MKNILFPTDFSEAANKAFIYALHFADKFQATITTLHVFQFPDISASHLPTTLVDFYDTVDLYEFESYRDAIPPLVKIAEQHGFGHIDMKHVMEKGEPGETIIRVAERDQIDMIIMGTTGARGLKEIFLGSVAGEIMENAHCPVLGVPEKSTFDGAIDEIAFTTAFLPEEKAALHQILELTAPFKPHIHCLNVDLAHTAELTGKVEKFRSELGDTAEGMTFRVLEGIDFFKEVTRYLEVHNIDFLVMVTHKRTFMQELFHYSKTKKMAYHTKIPVLALQAPTA